jgi:type III restriction enzyme
MKGNFRWLAPKHPQETLGVVRTIRTGTSKTDVPDMLVFRREGHKIKIDILDPHDDSRADAAEKAAGMADFARKHGAAFGRIEMIRIVKGQIERLRLHQESVRDKVIKVSDLKHLTELYGQLS